MSFNFSLYELIPDAGPLRIVDIGASEVAAPELYTALVEAGRATVVAFEPDAAACEKLRAKNLRGRTVLPYFVGDGTQQTYYETNYSPTGSLLEPNTPLLDVFQLLGDVTKIRSVHSVKTVRLDDIAEVGDIDYVKIDVQGAELAVFEGGPCVLASAVAVCTEVAFVELYKNQPLFADVDKVLRGMGFSFHTFEQTGSRCFKPLAPKAGPTAGLKQILWADAIYVRDFMSLDVLTENKLKKLAIITHDLLGSPDLCHFTLRSLDRKFGGTFAEQYLRRAMNGGG